MDREDVAPQKRMQGAGHAKIAGKIRLTCSTGNKSGRKRPQFIALQGERLLPSVWPPLYLKKACVGGRRAHFF